MTFHPDTVSAHLEMVRAQLERLAHERGLASAFHKDGQLAPNLQTTDLGRQFEQLTRQIDLAETVKEALIQGAKAGAVTLLVSGTGAAAVVAHRRGWTRQLAGQTARLTRQAAGLAQRAGHLAGHIRSKSSRLNPFRRGKRGRQFANTAAAFVADLAGTGQVVTVYPVFHDETSPLDQRLSTGPLVRSHGGQFVVCGETENLIFPVAGIVNVALTVNADGSAEAIITVSDFWYAQPVEEATR
jgi:hypothetical protein